MTINYNSWFDTLTHHVEDSWLELMKVIAACHDENLVLTGLVKYELSRLKTSINDAKLSEDAPQLEECLRECQTLSLYYSALIKQKQRAAATGSTFSQLAFERLRNART